MSDLIERLHLMLRVMYIDPRNRVVIIEAVEEIDRLTAEKRALQKDVNDFLDIRRKDAKRIAELEAALVDSGRAFAEYGDHIRQTGCYALAAKEKT